MIHTSLPLPGAARAYMEALPPGDWWVFDASGIDRSGVPAVIVPS